MRGMSAMARPITYPADSRFLHEVVALVPAPDDALLVLLPEHAQGGRVEREVAASRCRQPEPVRGQDAEHVRVREERNVAVERGTARDHPVGARAHLVGRFAAADAAGPDGPAGRLLADLRGGTPLVRAVVPL